MSAFFIQYKRLSLSPITFKPKLGMLFNSFEFLLFFPLVLFVFAFAGRWKWLVLLIASYTFYMSWKWEYILLILGSTIVDYLCARGMEDSSDQKRKRLFLGVSMFSNLALLIVFKYLDFFISSVNSLSSSNLALTHLLLPVGISFYTFQTMSYSIDVYHGRAKVEKHFGRFALFVSFFPQLVAGPIERAKDLMHQLRNELQFKTAYLIPAGKLFLWGLFKKVVIADRLALIVDPVFNEPNAYHGGILAFASVLFAVQIYCDFSGYVDMALAIAKCFNVQLRQNFNTPYFAHNISNFWHRWHITLSQWFRDYVYIPLGGNRGVKWRWYYNLFITFLVSGLWHGANWTFVIWGAIHGGFIVAEKVLPKRNISPWITTPFTFLVVCFAWIFFRANTVNDAFNIIASFADFGGLQVFIDDLLKTGISKLHVILAMVFIAVLFLKDAWTNWNWPRPAFTLRAVYYAFVFFSIVIFAADNAAPFIYFQF